VKENVLFIAAGVLLLFSGIRNQEFVLRLLARFPGCELLFDVCSPAGMRVQQEVVQSSRLDQRSNLTWGLKDKRQLLAWDPRLRLLGVYHYIPDPGIGLRTCSGRRL